MSDLSQLSTEELLGMLQTHTAAAPPQPQQMNPLQARMGIRGMRSGQGTDTLLPNIGSAIGSAGYDVGGAVTDVTGSPALGTVANVATEAVPMAIGGGLGAAAKVPEAAQGLGRWLMGKAMSPLAADWKSGKAQRAIETMLEKGYNSTKGGVQGMRDVVSSNEDKITSALATSGKELNQEEILQRVLPVYDKYLAGGSAKEVSAIGEAARDFATNPGVAGHESIPIQLAQQIKQTMGKDVGSSAYGMGLKPAGERDAKKAIIRALKEDISKAEPSVAPLNAESSALLNAIKIAERKAILEGNKNPVPLLPAIGAIAHDPMATLGLWANSSALAKSLAARLLYSQAPAAGAPAGRLAGTMAGYLSGTPPEE